MTWIVGTIEEVAQFAGVAESTIHTEWVPAGMPGAPGRGDRKGRYDLGAIFRWYRARANNRGSAGSIDEARRRADLAIKVARAKQEQFKVNLLERKAVPLDVHEREMMLRSGWFISVLGLLPALAPQLANKDVRKRRKVLIDFARQVQATGYGVRDESAEETAPVVADAVEGAR